MQSMLIAVTVVSAAVAIVMCAIVVRMLRDARRRSDARVEALLAMADEPRGVASPDPEPTESTAATPAAPRSRPARIAPERDALRATASQDLRQLERDDLDLNPGEPVTGITSLFAARRAPSTWGRRIGAAAAVAAVLVAGSFAIGSWNGRPTDDAAAGAPAGASSSLPLELLSLSHTAHPRTLTISGLVQNPRGAAALDGVTAVAFLFARDGGFIASGRAPLDFTRLEPGSESPFVVQIPIAAGVARYRVGFRNRNGAVISHVDRRTAGPLAQHR